MTTFGTELRQKKIRHLAYEGDAGEIEGSGIPDKMFIPLFWFRPEAKPTDCPTIRF